MKEGPPFRTMLPMLPLSSGCRSARVTVGARNVTETDTICGHPVLKETPFLKPVTTMNGCYITATGDRQSLKFSRPLRIIFSILNIGTPCPFTALTGYSARKPGAP